MNKKEAMKQLSKALLIQHFLSDEDSLDTFDSLVAAFTISLLITKIQETRN